MIVNQRIAIVYDWIDKWGGVERVLLTLHEMFPDAVFYTSVYDKKTALWAKDISIKTSFIQGFPEFIKKNRVASIPFYMFAFENFDFKDFDLVISVTSSFSKSVITMPETRHICYLLTPTRFLWSHKESYFRENPVNRLMADHMKTWDMVASRRPDKIISISESVSGRCLKFYGRESQVVYPPFDLDYWQGIKSVNIRKPRKINEEYYLIVSRLESYKKVDLAVKVFNSLGRRLVIVGKGTRKGDLKNMSGKNISFYSNVSDADLAVLYRDAKALIMPQEEDFGYVSLESQFFGTPVITHHKGGGTETVKDKKTGIFFDNKSETSLRRAIARMDRIGYNLRANLEKDKTGKLFSEFAKSNFIKKFKEYSNT